MNKIKLLYKIKKGYLENNLNIIEKNRVIIVLVKSILIEVFKIFGGGGGALGGGGLLGLDFGGGGGLLDLEDELR